MVFILVVIKKVLGLGKVHLNGIMDRYFWESGEMEWKMDSENGKLLRDIIIKDNGTKIGSMVKVILSITSVLIKGNSKIF